MKGLMVGVRCFGKTSYNIPGEGDAKNLIAGRVLGKS